jgi:hypothetical protein
MPTGAPLIALDQSFGLFNRRLLGANDYRVATPEARNAIKQDISSAAEAMRIDGTITMWWPYLLATARTSKADDA